MIKPKFRMYPVLYDIKYDLWENRYILLIFLWANAILMYAFIRILRW